MSVKYKRLDFRRSVGIRGKALVIVISILWGKERPICSYGEAMKVKLSISIALMCVHTKWFRRSEKLELSLNYCV